MDMIGFIGLTKFMDTTVFMDMTKQKEVEP